MCEQRCPSGNSVLGACVVFVPSQKTDCPGLRQHPRQGPCWSPACIPSEGAHTVRCSKETSLCYVWSWQCFPSSYKNKNCTGENPHFSSQKKKKLEKSSRMIRHTVSSLCVKVCLTSVHCVMFSLLRGPQPALEQIPYVL